MSDWEGGIRVNAFVSGGLVPAVRRGGAVNDYIHVSDWYATFCRLAGVEAHDHRAATAGLPPVDSIDQWQVISGEAPSLSGNRTEIHISEMTLIQGNFKLLTGGLEMFESRNTDKLALSLSPSCRWTANGTALAPIQTSEQLGNGAYASMDACLIFGTIHTRTMI